MTDTNLTASLPDAARDELRQQLALTKCIHDVDISLGPPCSWCLTDQIQPLIVHWLTDAHNAGVEQSAGSLRLLAATLEAAETDVRRYGIAWRSARERARRVRECG